MGFVWEKNGGHYGLLLPYYKYGSLETFLDNLAEGHRATVFNKIKFCEEVRRCYAVQITPMINFQRTLWENMMFTCCRLQLG